MIIRNNIIPFKGFAAINLFGIIFVRKDVNVTDRILNHEKIHTAQMQELLYIFFYLLYVIEWLIKLLIYGKKSYYYISFEIEAYENENNYEYLSSRRHYVWINHIRTKK